MVLRWLENTSNRRVLVFTFLYFLLYCTIVLLFQSPLLIGDEKRYLVHAAAILNFQFTPSDHDMWLWNGPGYPLMITPFVAIFSDPVLPIRLLNAALLAGSIFIFYRALLFLVEKQVAFLAFLAFGSYFLLWKSLPLVMTEIPSVFFVCWIIYYLLKPTKTKKDWLVLSCLFAFSAMIKIVFGYIITVSVLFFLAYHYLIQKSEFYLKASRMFVVAFFLCTPWLMYTYSKTGKIFYWAASGGMNLYWMSNPIPHEHGEYMDYSFESAIGVPEAKIGFEKSHGEEIQRIVTNYKFVARDDEFKRVAIENIKKHPKAFLKNIACNIGRFFFNYPYSYYTQRPSTLINIFINAPMVTFLIIGCIVLFFQLKKTPPPLIVIITVTFGYLAINFPLSVLIRMLFVIVPMLLVWFAFIANDIWAKYAFYRINKSNSES